MLAHQTQYSIDQSLTPQIVELPQGSSLQVSIAVCVAFRDNLIGHSRVISIDIIGTRPARICAQQAKRSRGVRLERGTGTSICD